VTPRRARPRRMTNGGMHWDPRGWRRPIMFSLRVARLMGYEVAIVAPGPLQPNESPGDYQIWLISRSHSSIERRRSAATAMQASAYRRTFPQGLGSCNIL
jgi:hypothetical protein